MGDEPGPAGLSAGYQLPASTPQPSVLGAWPAHCSKMGCGQGEGAVFQQQEHVMPVQVCSWLEDLHLVLIDSDQIVSEPLVIIWSYFGCRNSAYLMGEGNSMFKLVRLFKIVILVVRFSSPKRLTSSRWAVLEK